MVAFIKQEINAKSDHLGNAPVQLNIEDWAGRVSLDIIGQAGFGSDFASLQNPNTSLNTAYRGAFVPDGSSKLFFLLTLLTSPKFVSYFPFKKNDQIRDGVAAVTQFIKGLIDNRKGKIHMDVDEKQDSQDIMSVAMQSGAFDTDSLVDQSKTLLGAGHET
jgi:cytochrome P450